MSQHWANGLNLRPHTRMQIMAILGPNVFQGSLEDLLQQAAVEVLDAKAALEKKELLVEAMRGELRTLAALVIRQQHLDRIVVTRREFDAIPADLELYIESPEKGVRIYELRRRDQAPVDPVVLQ